jgi:hypothetical protein
MQKPEDPIWDAITNSAKTKFDFASFENEFKDFNEYIAENILFNIILGFASDKDQERIVNELHSAILRTGINWKVEEINAFVSDKDKILMLEILVMKLARTMLNEGVKETDVMETVNNMLIA